MTSKGCSTPQNYKNLKAIPNKYFDINALELGVRHHKITKI